MRVLVPGDGGMLSRDVMRAADDAIGLTIDELDVTDAGAVEAAVRDAAPDAVVNCAAWTNVDGAEAEEAAAMRVNEDGARNVAAAAAAVGALVVYPSTDYVFDGTKREPYVESDQVGPQSAYGRSKLAGERATAEANPRHLIVRTSWLFGVGGPNFVATMLRLSGDVKVVADEIGCPTYTGHLAGALLELVEAGTTGVVHCASGGTCSWHEFAAEIFSQAGKDDVQLTPQTAEEYRQGKPGAALRPAYSVLRSERPDAPRLPEWREGLTEYLAERAAAAL